VRTEHDGRRNEKSKKLKAQSSKEKRQKFGRDERCALRAFHLKSASL
jgi:hypothetical protein